MQSKTEDLFDIKYTNKSIITIKYTIIIVIYTFIN